MFTDTHAHFSEDEGSSALGDVLSRAAEAGVQAIVAVGGSPDLNRGARSAAVAVPGRVWITFGHDRDQAAALAEDDATLGAAMRHLREDIEAAAVDGLPVVGVGELGLDFHYSPETAEAQMRLAAAQLALAREMELPAVVHSREADSQTLTILGEHAAAWRGAPGRMGVLHCFTGGAAFARALLELGYYISFSGIVTFRNAADLREVAGTIPDDRLLIETDTPYLAPVPHRGRRNEPSYLPHVAAAIAAVRGVATKQIATLTTRNAQRLFGIQLPAE